MAAPASLLALVAWQSGNRALANVALDRALADDPAYNMAKLLRQAINSGAPPAEAYPPMTPEEVAAYYDDAAAQHQGQLAIAHHPQQHRTRADPLSAHLRDTLPS